MIHHHSISLDFDKKNSGFNGESQKKYAKSLALRVGISLLLLGALWTISSPVFSASDGKKLPAPAIVNRALKPGESLHTLSVNGQKRDFLLYTPPNASKTTSLPLVFAFHGAFGTSGIMEDTTLYESLAAKENFIVAFPQAYTEGTLKGYLEHGYWNSGGLSTLDAGKDIAFVKAMINFIPSIRGVDTTRLYATGMSSGGFFTNRVACEMSDILAAIAPSSGTLAVLYAPTCKPKNPMPIAHFHGTKDPIVPFKGGPAHFPPAPGVLISAPNLTAFWAKTNGCNLSPTVTRLPDIDPSDGTTVDLIEYNACKSGAPVRLYQINNGGHAWPGAPVTESQPKVNLTTQDISATQAGWDFMKQFRRYKSK